jgi:hypothetical protein
MPAALSMVGQYTAWVVRMSLPIKCTEWGHHFCSWASPPERGYNPQVAKYTDMRQLLPADRRGASATTRDDLVKIMNHYSGGKVQRAAADKPFAVGQSRALIEHARQQLAQGNSVIMLNGGFSGTKGHYTVIKAVNDDGSIQVADPGTGRMRTISAEQLEFAMRARQNGGRGQAYLMSLTG